MRATCHCQLVFVNSETLFFRRFALHTHFILNIKYTLFNMPHVVIMTQIQGLWTMHMSHQIQSNRNKP